MIVVLDTTACSLIFIPGAVSSKRHGKKPIRHAKERLEAMIERVAESDGLIIIPTPVLSEVIVKNLDHVDDLLKVIRTSEWFRVDSFDSAAAVELATRTAQAIKNGDKREGLQADWTKVKFDRQIVAIALVNGASEIISDDSDITSIGQRWGITVTSVEALPRPKELIPPPLLAHLEDEPNEEEAPNSAPAKLSGGGYGHIEDSASPETTKAGEKEETIDI